MRFTYILLIIFFCTNAISAQVFLEEYPLEANPVLQREAAKAEDALKAKLSRLFGEEEAGSSRDVSHDCDDDGVYENGETIYVLTGESLTFCLDTTGFAGIEDLSISGNSGVISLDSTCFTYEADPGIELGLGDTIRVELCLPDNGGCNIRTFPVVVKRENRTFVEPAVTLQTEQEVVLCASPANYQLPAGITGSTIPGCHDPLLSLPANGNKKDSCLLLTAQRFAGADTVCLEINNDYCIIDRYEFPYRVIADTLELPFMDDFSYDGPYPDFHWLDKKAFVNTTWGYQPPSVGFATMDGLDEGGTQYGGGYGPSDYLTSNYINLAGYDADDNVYLSFYVEPKGYGYQPNNFQDDKLVLEFKDITQEWVTIDEYEGTDDIPIEELPPFMFKAYHINLSQYLYNGFQFRFVNYGSNLGIRDIWHVDYVRLVDQEVPDTTFEDIAFTNLPNFILEKYSSMPWRHFEGNEAQELRNSIDIELYSQFPVTTLAEPSGSEIREVVNDMVTQTEGTLLTDPLTQKNVPPAEHKFHTNPITIETGDFPALSGDSMIFEFKYFFTIAAQNPGLFPQVARNDTVSQRTVMSNYFAYDDGTAETAMRIGLDQGGRVATEFVANIDDSLRAVQIHFPYYSNPNTGKFHLKIYTGELSDEPVYEKFLLEPFYPNTLYDTLQAYTTYRLTDDFGIPTAVFIPAGKFYIALEQGSSISLPVRIGLDKNTPEAKQYQYLYDGDTWLGLGNNGAAMIRAVVGDYAPSSTPVEEPVTTPALLDIFPNPSRGIFNIRLDGENYEQYQVSVFNAAGQLILAKTMEGPELDLSEQVPGIYFIKVENLKTKANFLNKVSIFR